MNHEQANPILVFYFITRRCMYVLITGKGPSVPMVKWSFDYYGLYCIGGDGNGAGVSR